MLPTARPEFDATLMMVEMLSGIIKESDEEYNKEGAGILRVRAKSHGEVRCGARVGSELVVRKERISRGLIVLVGWNTEAGL